MRFTALLCLALATSLVRAQTGDLDVQAAYRLDIVLDVAKHRLLTDVFKQTLRRELEEGIQAAYGDLARIRVFDRAQLVKDQKEGEDRARAPSLLSRLDEVRKLGLQKPLDDWRDIQKDGVKTHFVLVDFVDDQYEVQARQHDGLTGQASPIVRREQTADRSFVSRLAAILVDRDFGIVGAVPPGATKTAVIQLKGVGRGDLTRFVQKGDVFLVVPIPKGGTRTSAALNAVLQVLEPPDVAGRCQCRLLDRFESIRPALRNPLAASYRCLKIHTIKGPVRIRVMQEPKERGRTPEPVDRTNVTVRRQGFEGEDATLVAGQTDDEGLFGTDRSDQGAFDRLAFVTLPRLTPPARVPVPILDDRPALVRVQQQAQDLIRLLIVRKGLWDDSAYSEGLAQQELFRELQVLESKPNERMKAVQKAKLGVEASRKARADLEKEHSEISKEAEERKVKLDMSYGEAWLKFIDAGLVKLDTYLKDQDAIDKDEKDPNRLKYLALVQQGRLEEGRAQFGKALEVYQEAARLPFADAGLKKHIEELAAKWKVHDENHQRARNIIYESFPMANLVKDAKAMEEVKWAFQQCRTAKDVLAPQKLLQEILAQGGKLKEVTKNLQDFNEEDRKTAMEIDKLAGELKKLGEEVQAYLQANTK